MLFNMTKSELYRASRMKCTYIIPLIVVGLVFFMSFMYMKLDEDQIGITESAFSSYIEDEEEAEDTLREDIADALEDDKDEDKGSILGEGPLYDWDVDNVFNIYASASDILLMTSIFVGIYIGMLYSTGTDKNMLIASKHRNTLTAARAITLAIYTLVMVAVEFGSTVLTVALFGKSVTIANPAELVRYSFLVWFLIYTFSMLIMLIANLVKSQAAAITIGIILAYGVLNLIIMLIDVLIHKLFDNDSFYISDYTITGRIQNLRVFSSDVTMIKSLVIGAVALAIIAFVHASINRKRDLC